MHPDNGPPNGDFAAYVESLNRARQASNPSSIPSSRPTSNSEASMLAASTVSNEAESGEADSTAATLRRELGPLLRFTIIAFLLLGMASALGSPYSTMARIAALVIAVYVIRRAMTRTADIRARLRDRVKNARR